MGIFVGIAETESIKRIENQALGLKLDPVHASAKALPMLRLCLEAIKLNIALPWLAPNAYGSQVSIERAYNIRTLSLGRTKQANQSGRDFQET